MKKIRRNLSFFLFLLFSALCIGGCATPFPSELNIVPPAPGVPREIAAFSGVWKGTIAGFDFGLVVEKIDIHKAEVIYSFGMFGGYMYATADVLPGPSIEWIDKEGYKITFKMDGGLDSLSSALVYPNGGKYRGEMKRIETPLNSMNVELIDCPSDCLLPENFKITPPSSDIPTEIAAFSGMWGGKWGAAQDTIIVIEKIDTEKANIIVSLGTGSLVIGEPNSYFNVEAKVLPGPVIRWEIEKGKKGDFENQCPCVITLTLNKDKNMLIGYWELIHYKAKSKAEMVRCKEK